LCAAAQQCGQSRAKNHDTRFHSFGQTEAVYDPSSPADRTLSKMDESRINTRRPAGVMPAGQ
jgi:hypothetical protein